MIVLTCLSSTDPPFQSSPKTRTTIFDDRQATTRHRLFICGWAISIALGWPFAVARGQSTDAQGQASSHGSVETMGFSLAELSQIDALVETALSESQMAGAVVCIGRRDGIAYRKAYGNRQTEPEAIPMTLDTLFDLASLTKPLATGLSVMQLVDQGKVRLLDPVATYVPEFARKGKEQVTVLDLLTHQGGLIPDNALSDYQDGPESAWERIWDLELRSTPGTQFKYTDVGFLVLGKLVERVSGETLDDYVRHHLYQPLGLKETGFTPTAELAARAAATEQRNGRWMVGEVHDPRAYLLDGVAGHAGLFSTADDLSVLCQMLLNEGHWNGQPILSALSVRRMSAPERVPGDQIRGLGWDKQSAYSSNRGQGFSARAFGHGGFTGTALWIDPELDLFVIFLSNRLHPDGNGTVNRLAGSIGTIAAAALTHHETPAPVTGFPEPVRTGADVLERSGFAVLKGKRVGLITNHTGVTSDGVSLVKLLHQSSDVQLSALFSPEHGFEGKLDQSLIGNQTDQESGLEVFSLYGETRKPTAEMLRDIDVLVFDIQDIGTRFYTYVSTMGLAMEVAAEQGLEFVVLDRPNPLGGVAVRGPVLDAGKESFVGFHPVPVQHGMTVGELACLFKEERRLGLKLNVVRCENWSDRRTYDRTGLAWVSPSPNMRNYNEACLYPGVGLFEMTNLSVGRGTDTPFEWIGAPWIDPVELSLALNRLELAGVRFIPTSFTPESSKFSGETCHGVYFVITDHARLDALELAWGLATTLRDLYPNQWKAAEFSRLLANGAVFEGLQSGMSREELRSLYQSELDEFQQRRKRYLLY